MEPVTIITSALSILKATGLDEKLSKLMFGESGSDIAEKVITIAQDVTAATDLTTVVKDVEQDPNLAAQVKQALISQETELYKLALCDRADARAMQKAAFQQNDPKVKGFIYNFAWFWSSVAALFIFIIVLYPIPETNVRFADTVLGFMLGTIIATILQFFYGSMLKQGAD